MFVPPFCPNQDCVFHAAPGTDFYRPHGSYQPRCRSQPIPRFRCKGCLVTFSRQTFRFDRGMRKPHLIPLLFRHLVSGGSLRQAARMLGFARKTIARALERLGRHATLYHQSALTRFAFPTEHPRFQFDELETHESHRILKPLTVGTLLQERTRFLMAITTGTLRSRASQCEASKARRAEFEKIHGQRPNESRRVIRELLETLTKFAPDGPPPATERLCFITDEKTIYPEVLREVFGNALPRHETVSSKLVRDGRNPLAPINQLDTMTRHHNARLQRESIAASKKELRLRDQLAIFVAWWNYWRKRTNQDRESPAKHAGVLPRRVAIGELFGWRQDFGPGKLPLFDAA